jgi:hypothetical protein
MNADGETGKRGKGKRAEGSLGTNLLFSSNPKFEIHNPKFKSEIQVIV